MSQRLLETVDYFKEILDCMYKADRVDLYLDITSEQIKTLFELFVNLFGLGVEKNTCIKYYNSSLVQEFLKSNDSKKIPNILKKHDRELVALLRVYLEPALARANTNSVKYKDE